MFEKYIEKYFTNLLTWGLGSLIFGVPIITYFLLRDYLVFGVLALSVFLIIVSYVTYTELTKETEKQLKIEIDLVKSQVQHAEQLRTVAENNENLWKQTLKERTSGFPTLLSYISRYEELLDERLSGYLKTKSHPAVSSAETVKAEAKRRRDAEFMQRKTQSIIEYYENIAPFLLDFKEQEIDESEEALKAYTEEENEDPVTYFVAKDEYRKLPSVERNQLALDRFWRRSNKSK